MGLGVYPDVTLKRAREKPDEARKLPADGVDPSLRRREEKATDSITFESVARKAHWMPETFVIKMLGSEPIAKVTALRS
jgi:hypothetical protein